MDNAVYSNSIRTERVSRKEMTSNRIKVSIIFCKDLVYENSDEYY